MFGSTSDPLGELLKRFRARCHLTQQQLATAIGVHRATIGRWEEGSFLPESKALVLDLAKHLHLDEQETRQLLEASLTAFVSYWSVPLPRNPLFTGREEVLEELHAQLGIGQAVALTQSSALHGLGGVGKTQIALEYAYRYALEYSAVFWIGAETDEQIVTSLLHIADTLQLPEREDKDQQRMIAAVQRWLSTHGQWLLIWDNIEDLTILQRFLPTARSGAILLTTRRQALGTLAWGLNLLPMDEEEGLLLLLRRAKVLSPEATGEQVCQLAIQEPAPYAAATELVTILGGLPLALDQAGAYLEETHCGLPAYLDLFRTRRDALLQLRGEGIQDHPASVSATFHLSITAAAGRHPAVRELLQVCALLQPDAIPEEIFCQGGEHLGPTLEMVCCDPLEWDRVVSVACSYSLLSRQPEEHTLSMHRLVQAVLLDTMAEEEQEQWNGRVIKALDAVFPETQGVTHLTSRQQRGRLMPHALLVLHRSGSEGSLIVASLVYKTAQYLRERGQDTDAEQLYQRALHIREQVLGLNHPEVAAVLHFLAVISYNRSEYRQAEQLHQRALHIREQALGLDHPEVAGTLNNLAILAYSQGRYTEAEALYQRALHIREQALGLDHPEAAVVLNNLAELYRVQGKYAQAEPLYQRALQITEQAQIPAYPLVCDLLNGLADLYRVQGKYAQAEPLYQRALQIAEQAQGTEHFAVAIALNNLADLYRMQGSYAEAEPLYQRALHIYKQFMDDPDVASTLNGLANLFREQKKYTEAEVLFRQALSIREQLLGPDHPDTAHTLHDLALLRQKQGNLDEAISFAERALSIRLQSLGGAHPNTLATRTLFTQLSQEQARVREAAPSEPCAAEASHPRQEDSVSPPLHNAIDPSSSEYASVQAFLDACCELHPHVQCGIGELWQAYDQWTVSIQQCVPLPRRAFAAQIKVRGCRTDRTTTTRIWRGIRLRDKIV